MRRGLSDLEWLLEYEMRASRRYRRFVTLVMAASKNRQLSFKDLARHTLRESDELFQSQDVDIILMGETNLAGALRAIGRYKSVCNEEIDLRFAVVVFPRDAQTAPELLKTLNQRLKKALELKRGAVVAGD